MGQGVGAARRTELRAVRRIRVHGRRNGSLAMQTNSLFPVWKQHMCMYSIDIRADSSRPYCRPRRRHHID